MRTVISICSETQIHTQLHAAHSYTHTHTYNAAAAITRHKFNRLSGRPPKEIHRNRWDQRITVTKTDHPQVPNSNKAIAKSPQYTQLLFHPQINLRFCLNIFFGHFSAQHVYQSNVDCHLTNAFLFISRVFLLISFRFR